LSPLRKIVALIVVSVVALVASFAFLVFPGDGRAAPEWLPDNMRQIAERTPAELIRYAVVRLEGHPNLAALVNPPLHWLQSR
jgi:hypothetical protein